MVTARKADVRKNAAAQRYQVFSNFSLNFHCVHRENKKWNVPGSMKFLKQIPRVRFMSSPESLRTQSSTVAIWDATSWCSVGSDAWLFTVPAGPGTSTSPPPGLLTVGATETSAEGSG
ncbi:hypothetical protein HPB47_008250 [Ixodes persulcatus]|uniref:Uncharacterized protein n=1 Tax=Ixodes persulcatus TaxID=34615 RepID=A0AC60P579_IXOPE|nr:hypothetical protein HPB47_008250 [Ixodes persulcatus]